MQRVVRRNNLEEARNEEMKSGRYEAFKEEEEEEDDDEETETGKAEAVWY